MLVMKPEYSYTHFYGFFIYIGSLSVFLKLQIAFNFKITKTKAILEHAYDALKAMYNLKEM